MSEAIKLFQYNTLGALMAGLYGGTLTVGELLEHGDLGLGTLDSIDGELIVLDGKAYQAKGSEGKVEVVEVAANEKVPYAAVVPHQAEVIFRQRFEMTDKELEERIESYYDGVNLFRSIKIKGHFKHMHVRMIPKSAPDTKFAEVATHQPEYEADNISGTIVGIWTPEMFHGVSVAGYHCTLFRMICLSVGTLWTSLLIMVLLKSVQLTNSINVSQFKIVSISSLNSMSMKCVKILPRLNKLI